MRITAAVTQKVNAPFTLNELEIDEPRAHEVLVRIVGVGVCHTDLVAQEGMLPLQFPAVLGHEGAGVVERVGTAVRKVVPGDRVALSFLSCGCCRQCVQGAPSYCNDFLALNLQGKRLDASETLRDGDRSVSGSFFGQSSFATHALAHERNTVKLPAAMPLEIAGILGCGVQTGAGAVLRSLDCRADSSLLVLGGGAVGLSAVMAARLRGVQRIVVAEIHASRRELALELGANDVIDPLIQPLPKSLSAILPEGADYILDTTGHPEVVAAAPSMMARRGVFGFVGLPPVNDPALPLPGTLRDAMRRGLTLRGIYEGDSDIDDFIGELATWYLQGKFPLDKLVRTFPLHEINEAIAAQRRGECVKPVLLTSLLQPEHV